MVAELCLAQPQLVLELLLNVPMIKYKNKVSGKITYSLCNDRVQTHEFSRIFSERNSMYFFLMINLSLKVIGKLPGHLSKLIKKIAITQLYFLSDG